ncbi:lipoprotein-anchoring transpeptidase ErfK/SrfK [Rhizobium leguminosarum]|uniref:Lipoprotein-anchoring transpeptidase ErfK/SrfK n=1 Tax=Rhizobium esperanzae TaxID=1967781 RepID=A0A7W6UNF5_9HYPH|nr:lipoprotein-anchoring transpeptidase ErfK/SrfK [Rhizobium leguminosarum]MBB4441447.1 lipoprotein-anchoring transpeptidase ErfK/SrfK [Rhizobium esperanzae]MBB5261015.1 lipoprotein-anchoring transpeptidase ErfK/SrfK [Rhizobium leguminosarum]MBB6296233.1 lipoprotein-anchoring transpeptidase ErfK/SrfK [Rhizobium leguminosarum]MDH6202789.1 lipoprotein-anchoring transpeptidase ErfK/SrfK [Rhizobium leguminosarum]
MNGTANFTSRIPIRPISIAYGGYAVHATFDLKRLGRPASHGCVRLHPDNAAQFFSLAPQAGLANTAS